MNQPIRPTNAPACWGMQYSDGDLECSQCFAKDSCRPTCINRTISTQRPPMPQQVVPLPNRTFLPMAAQPVFSPMKPSMPAQLPSFGPMQIPIPLHQGPVPFQVHQFQPPPMQTHPNTPMYQGSPYLPDPNYPHPLVPFQRPGTNGPPYYFCQYPEETTAKRLGKNVVLRAAESIFGELMQFFRNWTWPPKQ